MFKKSVICLLTVLLSQPAWADLPIRRIMLYKHGVGYFERAGKNDGQEIVMEFKSSEMSDVLKSLTLIDRSGGKVAGVSYDANDPISKQLENFAFSVPKEASLGQVLDQFKGARLIVKTAQGGEVRGQILGVRRTHRSGVEVELATLLLETGELRSIVLTDAAEVRLEDARLQRDLATYLNVLATGQRRDRRTLRIQPGTARDLSVSYVVEAPVWKTSYRLVTDSERGGEALLQGWAIIDNPSDEDWRGVEVSLVSGLPISFVQNLYQAHYLRRPVVNLPYELALAPTIHEGRISGPRNELAAALREEQEKDNNRRDYRQMAQMMAKKSLQAMGQNAAVDAFDAPAPSVGERFADTVSAMTQAFQLGELFEYRVERRIDVPRNQSAMIPFVQTSVKAERIVLFDPASGRQAPFEAVLLTNSSSLTLDGGAITVLDGNRYVGEALIENLKPGESRPVSFAVDLGTTLSNAFDSKTDQVFAVKIRRGIITTTAKNVEVRTYTMRNADTKAKTMLLQHPVRAGWKLAAGSKPEETTARNYRFRVALPAKETVKLAITEEQEVSNTIALNNLNSELIANFARNKALTPEAQAQLTAILDLKDKMAETQRRVNAKTEELSELSRDQDRLRQNIYNLRSIPGQEAQVTRYIAKLSEQEKVIEAAQTTLAAERATFRRMQTDLDRTMMTLEI